MGRFRWAALRRFAWETLAVLSGILIAFALDAWWDTHQDQAELRESLSAVHAEFSDSRAQLDSVMAVNRGAIDGTDTFLRMTAPDIANLDPADAATVFRALMRADTFDPAASAIDAVISANVLERIDELQLRSALSAWSGGVSDLVEEQVEVRRIEASLRDLLVREAIADPVIATQASALDRRAVDARPALLALRSSEEARQMLMVRGVAVRLMLGEQQGLSERIDEILATLAGQIR